MSTSSSSASLQFDHAPQRILLVMPTWVGDVVMATPFVDALFGRFPDAEITLLMNRHLFGVLEGSPWVEHCLFWPPRNKSAEAKAQHKALIAELKGRAFDLAVMLPNSLRSAWVCWRSGARRRVGFNRDGRGLLLSDALPVPNREGRRYRPMPLVEYYAVLAKALGCEHPGDALTLYTTEDAHQAVSLRLEQEGADPSAPLVVLCPGANFGASKCWAPDRFAAVADQLVASHGVTVAISPGPGEEPLARAIAESMAQPSILLEAPCLTLAELKSLISRASLLLGNDTGPRHFGRAFDIPRVTVFGPTEARWTETSHGKETI
ncbi:MAG: lipopolysaccharide heptosyltransferase II, partial [Halieaceae bacterium]